MSCVLERCALCQIPGIHISTQLDELCHSVQKSAACIAAFPVSAFVVSGSVEMTPSNNHLHTDTCSLPHPTHSCIKQAYIQYMSAESSAQVLQGGPACRDPEGQGSTDNSGLHHYCILLLMKMHDLRLDGGVYFVHHLCCQRQCQP